MTDQNDTDQADLENTENTDVENTENDQPDTDRTASPEQTREQRAAQMPDELKVDIDQEKLKAWDEAKGDYGIDEDGERPIMVGEGEERPHHPRPDHEDRSSAEPTDGQQT